MSPKRFALEIQGFTIALVWAHTALTLLNGAQGDGLFTVVAVAGALSPLFFMLAIHIACTIQDRHDQIESGHRRHRG